MAALARHEIEVKKSRFLALCAPCDSADAALAWLQAQRDSAATHNCWAYRIGQQYRFSDDGEPGGSAGRPILAAIDGSGLDGIVALVIRWYGGTNLGVGGLVRAYGGAVAECLRLAPRIALIDEVELQVQCGFELLGAIYALLPAHQAQRLDERHDADGIQLQLRLPADRLSPFTHAVRDASRGRARITLADD